MNLPLPGALRRVAALDPTLAAALADDFGRLARAADALAWAQARLGGLLRCAGPSEVLALLVAEAKARTEVPVVWAVTWDGDLEKGRASFRALAGHGEVPAPGEVSRTVVGWVAREGRPAWSDDAASDARFAAAQSVVAYALRSVGCVPVGKYGVLYVSHPTEAGRFDADTRACLAALCSLAAPFLDEAPRARPTVRPVPGIVGAAPAMAELFAAVHAFAPMPWPALVLGETGTGKESVARALHDLSPRKGGPFVAINCGAIPDELAESTLFGHERGAFTGADRRREGLVERAAGGTLFLDEVGELSPRVQVKLLRLLQEGTFERVGGDRELRFGGRVVAATWRPLDDAATGFRSDLFHRLAACVLRVPPLRERREDVPALAAHLLEKSLAMVTGAPEVGLSRAAGAALAARDWPGNVRELENTLRTGLARALAEGAAEIAPHHLDGGRAPPTGAAWTAGEPATADVAGDLQAATDAFVKARVLAAVEAAGGNRTKAADALGVSRQWLHRLLARWE
ncbi:MAG: sigma 54-interacting transcriptional regulator [Myxococcota bacterium]